ncbi:Bug family tripartite tricarboxylate transporter substrate binding protein [Cupriavidus sp. SS-3]|uniref:Bug family tripartite tricarboxylate transporter substrate binding protein n=1 Tax=Cupriavidus sp. SS-3 TaxID=3109596 RepID=UPI002DB9B1A8|nr:tripartite tricarboxylate transporter substrate binding protein [Cupriavidus sp. SS-3]MEC3767174.1 tripartite tricarboxylate transporter substrate binding protein [Cupriavidus sp. SS-3]
MRPPGYFRPVLAALGAVPLLALLCTASAPAHADSWPSQPIRWVVPYPAGGGTDVVARTVAQAISPALGKQVVIDNRPGAATIVGADAVAHARPDGYTVLTADTATLAANPSLYKKLPYNADKDFVHIGQLARFPLVLVANPNFPARTLKEAIDYAQKHPGKVNFASPGAGSPHHLAMELFMDQTRVKMTHVPYKGAAPAVQDLLAGQVDLMFLDLASGQQNVQAGKLRALGVATPKRLTVLPSVPTVAEGGVAGFEAYAWQGMVAPAGTPKAVVARLNAELVKALKTPEVQKKLEGVGVEAVSSTPEEFASYARAEAERWGKLIKAKGITVD